MSEGRLSVRRHESLSRHTALRTGGSCELWLVAHDLAAVVKAVALARRTGCRLNVLGSGTRTVVRDGTVSGAILRLGSGFQRMTIEGETVSAGAGAPMPVLVQRAAAAGLAGLASHSSTPGSVGAALLLDEWEPETVFSVTILRRGKAVEVAHDEVVGRKNVIVLAAAMRLRSATASVLSAQARDGLAARPRSRRARGSRLRVESLCVMYSGRCGFPWCACARRPFRWRHPNSW